MSKTNATLCTGLALGLIGVLAYNRLRQLAAESEAEDLLELIGEHLKDLELAKHVDDQVAYPN